MQAKFTRASKKDNDLVTVSLAQFVHDDIDGGRDFEAGMEVVIVIEGIPVLFKASRNNEYGYATTASTRCFPRSLRLPRVGRPVYAEVTEVR